MFLLPKETWEVKKTPKKGRGVFVKEDLQPGTVIGDYIGTVIPTEDEEKYDNGKHFYLMYYHDRAGVFPNVQKPGIHLLNHSCTPNTWMYTYKGHTLYFAIRHIFAGEELTVSYLLNPQDSDCNPCDHLCLCESSVCSGTIHLTQKWYDAWLTLDEKETKKTKKERIRFGKKLPFLSSYPKSISDNPFYTLFGVPEKPAHIINSIKELPTLPKIRSLIRETGRILEFPGLNLRVLGILHGKIISDVISS